MKINQIIILVLFIFSISCLSENDENMVDVKQGISKNETIITWEDFGAKETLNLKKIKEIELIFCSDIHIHDSHIYYNDIRSPEYFITITDLEGNIINKTIRKGKGANEQISNSFICFNKEEKLTYTYDGQMLNILNIYKTNSLIKEKSPTPVNSFDIGTGFNRIVAVTKDYYIIENDTSQYKIAFLDSNKKIIKTLGQFNIDCFNKNNSYYINRAYKKNVIINKKTGNIVLIYTNIDVIEIFDAKGNSIFVGHGPENFELVNFQPDKIENLTGRYGLKKNKSKLAYLDGVVNDKYIYTLYAGFIFGKGISYCSDKILVFDWDGNPVKYLQLTEPITVFDIDEKTNTLYGYNTNTGTLYNAKLNL
ncbi:MAG: BF3164 family lipoprotein [Bacteroidota bacterium]|nr:BF3164 family lipoprotein [Bacteroidota bacterium]